MLGAFAPLVFATIVIPRVPRVRKAQDSFLKLTRWVAELMSVEKPTLHRPVTSLQVKILAEATAEEQVK